MLIVNDTNATYTALAVNVSKERQPALDVIRDCLTFPLTVKDPCGVDVVFERLEDLPLTDTPCSCGKPNHWLIRYKEVT